MTVDAFAHEATPDGPPVGDDLDALLTRGPRDNDADGRPCGVCAGHGSTIEPEHVPDCRGNCYVHGLCPVPVQVPCDRCRGTGTVYDPEVT